MPIDLQLTFKDGTKELHYIPLDLMYGEKPIEDSTIPRIIMMPGSGLIQLILLNPITN